MINFLDQLELCFRNMNSHLENCVPYWENHREHLWKMINRISDISDSSGNSLIIGAGNCYDLPLDLICKNYMENHLLDLDEQSLIHTMEACTFRSKINLIKKDLTGIDETEANELLRCLTYKEYNKAESILIAWIHGTICPLSLLGSKKYSLVISSTVSTQLLLPLIQTIEQSGNNRLIALAKQLGDILAEKHFFQFRNLLNDKNGVGIITSEQYAWGRLMDGRNLPLSNFIDKPELMLSHDTQRLIEKQGGPFTINGRINFDKLINYLPELQILSQDQWIWRFSENIYYLVKGWIIKK
ncbi:hypothetical protein ACFQZT_31195 [Paenibacillus sp. GCM10027628]|uniref:hypothetical protein n=1 Tax=Paenibacillus sp. GCM10027628 TaxID=3273413 RepID=UPI003640CCEC